MNKLMISAQIDKKINGQIVNIAHELKVSKSWIIQQALEQYLERYDEHLSDLRISSLKEGVEHKRVLKEYGLSD